LQDLNKGETEMRYVAKEVNGKGYIFDKQFSMNVPIAVENTIEFATERAEQLNNLNEMED
jgi:hypothetical protein